jgi:peroxiredoxin
MTATLTAQRTVLAFVLVAALGICQDPTVGEDAPPFELEAWAQLAKGEKPPSSDVLKGKVVLIEFWGTWCGPCVRAMPRIQALHARFKDRGLKVLGISYETLEVTKPFCEKNGYTFTIGSDPAKKVCSIYVKNGWPTSIVLGKDGKVAHVGNPYSAEEAVEKAMGLETDPPKLLTAALEALASKDPKRIKDDLGRVADRSKLILDLRKWAADAGGKAGENPESRKDFDAQAELAKLAQAWTAKDEAKKKASLDLLARFAADQHDAVPWAKRAYGKAAPVTKAEFAELLKAQRFDDALDALYLRSPATGLTATAAADKGFKEYSAKRAADARTEAKKALMCVDYCFANRMHFTEEVNMKFWEEMNVSGMWPTPDKKGLGGVLLGDGDATPSNAAFYSDCHFARALMMESIASGKEPQLAGLTEKIAKDREQVRKQLVKKYGTGEEKKKE